MECIHEFLAPYCQPHIAYDIHLNTMLESLKNLIQPDFHLDLYPCYHPIAFGILIWVSKCGFSQAHPAIECQLQIAAKLTPQMDATFMIFIHESTNKPPPPNNPFCSHFELNCSAFAPDTLPNGNTLLPIVIKNITWLDIRSINICVLLCGEDGKFGFKNGSTSCTGKVFYCGGIHICILKISVLVPYNTDAECYHNAQLGLKMTPPLHCQHDGEKP